MDRTKVSAGVISARTLPTEAVLSYGERGRQDAVIMGLEKPTGNVVTYKDYRYYILEQSQKKW